MDQKDTNIITTRSANFQSDTGRQLNAARHQDNEKSQAAHDKIETHLIKVHLQGLAKFTLQCKGVNDHLGTKLTEMRGTADSLSVYHPDRGA